MDRVNWGECLVMDLITITERMEAFLSATEHKYIKKKTEGNEWLNTSKKDTGDGKMELKCSC